MYTQNANTSHQLSQMYGITRTTDLKFIIQGDYKILMSFETLIDLMLTELSEITLNGTNAQPQKI